MPQIPNLGWYWPYVGAPVIFSNPQGGVALGFQWTLYSADSPITLTGHPSQFDLTRYELDELIRAGTVEMIPFGLIPLQ
jgi:hypothetical protein